MSEQNGTSVNSSSPEAQRSSGEFSALFGDLDLQRLRVVLFRSLKIILLILALAFIAAYLYMRYTPPLYESSSVLKLDIKSNAGILGLPGMQEPENEQAQTLSGEAELIRSKIIYEPLADSMKLAVSYFLKGRIMDQEIYKSNVFLVDRFKIRKPEIYGKEIRVDILNAHEYRLSYKTSENSVVEKGKFGHLLKTPDFEAVLTFKDRFSEYFTDYDLYFKFNSEDNIYNYLNTNLRVDIQNHEASIIKISFRDHNRRKARDIVQLINQIYLTRTVEAKNKSNNQILSFLENQLHITDESLRKAESGMEQFAVANKTVDVNKDAAETLARIDKLYVENTELKYKAEKLNEAAEQLYAGRDLKKLTYTPMQFDNPNLPKMIEELNKLNLEREQLLISSKENTFAVEAKKNAVKMLSEDIADILKQERRLLLERVKNNGERIGELESEFYGLPSKGSENNRLKRDFTLREEIYLMLLEKKAEFGIKAAGTIPEFQILSSPLLPDAPVHPRRTYAYGISFAVGLLFCLSLIAGRYMLYNTIGSRAELEKLTSAPILGIVPRYKKEKMTDAKLIVQKNPKSPISEAFRTIRTNIEFLSTGKSSKIISLTSTVGSEGKTFTSANLGGVMALSGKKVIILDMDMRKPKLHLAFEKPNSRGMSTLLIGRDTLEHCIINTPLEGLDIITAGPVPPNPSELIMLSAFDELLESLKASYDIILIDSPPSGLVTDALLIMKKVDVPIYTVRADYSKRWFVRNIDELRRLHRFNNLSIILNAVDPKHAGSGYGYGYYDREDESKGILPKIGKKTSINI